MNTIQDKLLLISHCRGIRAAKLRRLYQIDHSFSLLQSLKSSEYLSLGLITPSYYSTFSEDFSSLKLSAIRANLEKHGTHFLTILDPLYPDLLKEIPDPPLFLFCKGNLQLFQHPESLGVAGARQSTPYGREALDKILIPLIKRGFVIVSGLAEGIDTAAHAVCIVNGGRTIAVLGGGFQHIYPFSNRALANEIGRHHLLISEYAPHIKPQKWHFPERNRLISGLGNGTLIAEAKQRSGSLITAQYAMEQGRDVFAIPGRILDCTSDGTNELIKDGAKLVMTAEDILEEFYGIGLKASGTAKE
ncbi:DNA-processing protein DprA [Metabacillus sp. KIGAM252]|uniref:DNA-processing protein DprA n=1 Tax=Metabacillus flavus TaxID=2823519 RepID=A0ABS5LDZ5_9BACI|nr:DNA-processing protein DprA [Metabacillus flavus]